MFLLDSLLLAPGRAVLFLLEEMAKKAREEWLDDDSVKQELQQIYALLEAGQMSETEFASREYRLVEQLQQIAKVKFPDGWRSADMETPTAMRGINAEVLTSDVLDVPQALSAPAAPDVTSGVSLRPIFDMIAASIGRAPLRRTAPAMLGPAERDVQECIRDAENLERVVRWRQQKDAAAATMASFPAPPAQPAIPDAARRTPASPPAGPAIPDVAPPTDAALPRAVSLDRQAVPVMGQLSIHQVIDSSIRALSVLRLKVSTITSVARVEDGWQVTAELVERRSVPDTSDLLGVYELRLDEAGNLLRYERTRMRRRCDLGR